MRVLSIGAISNTSMRMNRRPTSRLLRVAAAASLLVSAAVLARTGIAPADLELMNLSATPVTYRSRAAVELKDLGAPGTDEGGMAVVRGTELRDGTIEVMLTGDRLPTADDSARGFVGVAFRVAEDRSRYECFYLRPTNGRADDQLRRNHSAQYMAMPEFPWNRLRAESPGQYESYVDLVPGEWTRVRIEVSGQRASLYVNESPQPTLIVRDLKLRSRAGAVALWVGPGTVAHFEGLRVAPTAQR
jgi:hypothetical protein